MRHRHVRVTAEYHSYLTTGISLSLGWALIHPHEYWEADMASSIKVRVLDEFQNRFGHFTRIGKGQSMISIGQEAARVYFRYSKVHGRSRTFYGLREIDLRELDGHNSYVCFLNDLDPDPILLPYSDFEEVFRSTSPATDGQYKVQILNDRGIKEVYIARVGRFNVEGYLGLDALAESMAAHKLRRLPTLTHCQVQTLLAAIGHLKGFDVFVPASDVATLDWSIPCERFSLIDHIPAKFEKIESVLSEIDVVWTKRGSNSIENLFEVEHSTPVYSGLLRFNDVLLTDPNIERFSIVSNDNRRALFSRQLSRPTFVASGLSERASFLEYANVHQWHLRLSNRKVDMA